MPNRDKSLPQELVLAAAAHFRARARGDRLLLISESEEHLLDGAIYVAIAEALAQKISWNDLRERLAPRYPLPEIQTALTVLAQFGYVHPARPSAHDAGLDAWLDSMGAETNEGSVQIVNLSSAGTEMLEQWLRMAEFRVSADAATTVVLTDDYLDPALAEIGRTTDRPWLPAKLAGHTLWWGPRFTPGRSPCWECLAWWHRMHRWQHWGVAGIDGPPLRPAVAHWPATVAIGAGMLAAAMLNSTLQDVLLTFDTRTFVQARHLVRPVPGCRTCDPVSILVPAPAPSDLRDFVSFATGIVEHLELSTHSYGGLFHARARFVHALPTIPARAVMRSGESFGKARTAEGAGIVAVAEAIERYSVSWRGTEPCIFAKPDEVDGIALEELGQYSDRQLAEREQQAHSQDSMFWVPPALARDLPIGWIRCRAVSGVALRHVPAAAVYYSYPFETEVPYFVPDSNGCAAGRTYEDALASALGELVERDALAIWWYNRVRRPAVRLLEDELDDIAFDNIAALRGEGRVVTVLDVTTDLEIPAYVVLAPRAEGSDVVFSAAAHICPRRALEKALAEASQIVYWKDRIVPDPALAKWLHFANVGASGFEWLLPDGDIELPPRRRIPAAEAVAEYAAKLSSRGISSYWVDLTRPETGVPVIRAIAPGLRHPWRRFAPGRLYDVPVKMGWLNEPLAEGALNPLDCML